MYTCHQAPIKGPFCPRNMPCLANRALNEPPALPEAARCGKGEENSREIATLPQHKTNNRPIQWKRGSVWQTRRWWKRGRKLERDCNTKADGSKETVIRVEKGKKTRERLQLLACKEDRQTFIM